VVAIGGGWGTLSEIALALKAGIPVVGVGTWEPVRGGAPVGGVVEADDPRAAVAEALRLSRH
jgi:predicted Rossmann-fold nucleotide-binding protein